MRGPFVVKKIETSAFTPTDYDGYFKTDHKGFTEITYIGRVQRKISISYDVYRYSHSRGNTGWELFAECPRRDIAEFVRDALNSQYMRRVRFQISYKGN